MPNGINSRILNFYKLNLDDRQQKIQEIVNLSDSDLKILQNIGYLSSDLLNSLSENVIGTYQLPLSIATNFIINDNEYLIPMVTEESSVVAAASFGAKITRKTGGFRVDPVKSIMTGQIQIIEVNSDKLAAIKNYINDNKPKLLELANHQDPTLIKLGGGAIDLFYRVMDTNTGTMVIVDLDVNVLDAMGANAVNTMVEHIATQIVHDLDVKVLLRIITNLSIKRIARCSAIFDTDLLGGNEVVDNILHAYAFAQADPFRAATHNKGIMNGISALALATGNDTRAIEAGAHAFASYISPSSHYSPLTSYSKNEQGQLIGKIELPLPMATIGGLTQKHPMVQLAFKILQVKSAEELSQIAAAVGLAQNLAALRALVHEGIQAGHMKLHHRKQELQN